MKIWDWLQARQKEPLQEQEIYHEPPQLSEVKQQWEVRIAEQISRDDPLLDEHSGLLEAIEVRLHQLVEDDILRQQLEHAKRLARQEEDKSDEVIRLQSRLESIRQQKRKLEMYLEQAEQNRRYT
ncbi:hypothetical protein [Butyricicoccus sp.]|uniref:hypothetical protein n=1 Tax=Butyricicoccus sp. TaxID=2049021 RepID=UPI003D7D7212